MNRRLTYWYGRNGRKFARSLSNWHKTNRIEYPWRKDRRIFLRCVVELLLRRTTAQAVTRNWNLVVQLSNPRLVAKSRSDWLKRRLSQFGLVNSRAREIKALAKAHLLKSLHRRTKENLRQLPGIGEYTASAILTFIADSNEIIVDSNIARIFSRITSQGLDPRDNGLLVFLEDLVPEDPGKCKSFQEALLDFSKLVCGPNYPLCHKCLAASYCKYGKAKNKLLTSHLD